MVRVGVINNLIKINNFINRTIKEKKLLKAAIIDKKDFLRPGYYQLERAVGYHFIESKPLGLLASKRFILSKIKYPYLAPIVSFIERLIPPFVVKIEGDNNILASQCMLSREGDIKIFDYTNKKVFVFPSDSNKFSKLINSKNILSSYLPIVKMKIYENENYYIEDLIVGKLFSQLVPEKQFNIFVSLLDNYIGNKNLINTDYKYSNMLFCNVMQLDFNSDIKEMFKKNKNDIIELIKSKPLSFSHCDLYGNNIIIDNENIFIIDIEKADVKPVFFDLLHLLVTEYFEGNKILFTNYIGMRLNEFFKADPLILFLSYLLVAFDGLSKENKNKTIVIDDYKLNAIKEIVKYF